MSSEPFSLFACLVVNPITVDKFAFPLIACWRVRRQTLCRFQIKALSVDERVGALCRDFGKVHLGLTVGFLLFWYSVVCAVESLSLFDLLFIS